MKANAIPFPPKKILVPLDLSEPSVTAWNQAQSLAKTFGARVEGLYVQEWLHSSMGLGMAEPYMTAHASRQALDALRARLGSDFSVASETGPIEQTILSWSRDGRYDLIIMGTHGRTGLERALKGSVAEAVASRSQIPVLVLHKRLPDIRMVLAPINFEPYALKTLVEAARVAQSLSARLTVLHVVDAPLYSGAAAHAATKHLLADAIDSLPEALRAGCRIKKQLAFGSPAEQIAQAAQEADLVILAAHGKNFLGDKLLGTTAERVLRHCPAAVLTVPTTVASERGHHARAERKASHV